MNEVDPVDQAIAVQIRRDSVHKNGLIQEIGSDTETWKEWRLDVKESKTAVTIVSIDPTSREADRGKRC